MNPNRTQLWKVCKNSSTSNWDICIPQDRGAIVVATVFCEQDAHYIVALQTAFLKQQADPMNVYDRLAIEIAARTKTNLEDAQIIVQTLNDMNMIDFTILNDRFGPQAPPPE